MRIPCIPVTSSDSQPVGKATLTRWCAPFRFGLPTKNTLLGLPIGQHITFKAKDDDAKDFFRPYTPTTDDDTPGHVDFVIKVYPEGKMSQHLDKMEVGQTILFKGPKGRYQYQQGSLRAIGKSNMPKNGFI